MSTAELPRLTITMLSKMTTYELRQEVDRRGLLEELETINHNTLLKRLVQVVLSEEDERCHEVVKQKIDGPGVSTPNDSVQERLCRAREARKAEALERSKRRQAEEGYFTQKQLSNKSCNKDNSPRIEDAPKVGSDEEEPLVSKTNPNHFKVFVR